MRVGQRRLCRAHAEVGEALFPQVTEAKGAEAAVVISNTPQHGHYGVNADVPRGNARGTETTVKICDLRNLRDSAKTILVTWSTHNAYFPVRSLNAGSAQKCKTAQPEHWLHEPPKIKALSYYFPIYTVNIMLFPYEGKATEQPLGLPFFSFNLSNFFLSNSSKYNKFARLWMLSRQNKLLTHPLEMKGFIIATLFTHMTHAKPHGEEQ